MAFLIVENVKLALLVIKSPFWYPSYDTLENTVNYESQISKLEASRYPSLFHQTQYTGNEICSQCHCQRRLVTSSGIRGSGYEAARCSKVIQIFKRFSVFWTIWLVLAKECRWIEDKYLVRVGAYLSHRRTIFSSLFYWLQRKESRYDSLNCFWCRTCMEKIYIIGYTSFQ